MVDYDKLYYLQDRVLHIIFEEESEFYLTGGTCISRFYYAKRYSDDLDLFTNFSNTFPFSIKEILQRLTKKNLFYSIDTETKDFLRITVKEQSCPLQIDFVNDKVKRFGKILIRDNINIDNLNNILSNKLTAVISRDNPKDIFDIYLIALKETFDWSEILLQAKEKMHFEKENLIFRLHNFPAFLLKKLHLIDNNFLDNFSENFEKITRNILEEAKNNPNNLS
ncbi:nucleotidyl transferase AbiEii/AbiGii toxin family protein [bacterium]|nr:nucleotidyl transferase AbiEii/AbiGii toxin family protein [bacterium]